MLIDEDMERKQLRYEMRERRQMCMSESIPLESIPVTSITVQGFDQLCLTHCGEIDAILKDASKGQRKSIELAQNVVRQQLAAMKVPKGQKLETKGGDKSWTKSPNFSAKGYWPVVGDETGRKLTKLLVNKEQEEWKKNNNFNTHG